MRFAALCLLLACADKDDGAAAAEGCAACSAAEVCVAQLGEDETTERCAPLPAVCGDAVSCADSPCVGALYDLCDDGWIGVGCSEAALADDAPIVSCNPDSAS